MELHIHHLYSSSSHFLTSPVIYSNKFSRELKTQKSIQFYRVCAAKSIPENASSLDLQKRSKKELSRILRTEAAIEAIERKANSSKYNNLWPKAVLEALDDAIKGNRWESALKIFRLLRKQHWYEPRSRTYARLLVMIGKCRQPNQASLLFDLMRSDGLQLTLDVYTALASAYGLSGLLDEAWHTIHDMKSISDCKPDVYTYSILIKCCMKFQRYDMIEHILAEMSYLGVECSTVTYNTIIDGYGKANLFEQMENSLLEMIESGMSLPDVFTLNSVIGAYGKCGNIEKMEKWFDEFQLMGIKPDVMTFNILIKSYGKAKMYAKMGSVLDYMGKRFYSPTTVTYNTIIETFGKAGNIDEMEEFFLKMKHQGMKPNSITYCSLISAYSRAGILEKVDSILRQVENSDVVLDTTFFNCAINAYGQAGDIERMVKLFLEMKDQQCRPDNITYATMIKAYSAQGMIEAAEDLQSRMISGNDFPETKLIGSPTPLD
ncbi:pentatricopeptide repeat-containing protein At3g53170-like isoform X1 [Ipomoea triloba]|uniref:pentatricopeptide repeat-containing protein At3g53170-like isoform X1 n=1 Tax=Ipomoea triloba TaxID=35885 RepID=UPI00125E85CD|nr:pentatricopeptide repeat-containing protein At3g53170-like isoform X1 [Ipomoea triloba]